MRVGRERRNRQQLKYDDGTIDAGMPEEQRWRSRLLGFHLREAGAHLLSLGEVVRRQAREWTGR